MNPEQIREFYDKYFYYILAGGILIGLLFGLVPLVLGIRKKKRNLGIVAIVSCAVVGGFSPILSIVAAVAFTIFILVISSREKNANSDDASQSEASE